MVQEYRFYVSISHFKFNKHLKSFAIYVRSFRGTLGFFNEDT